MQLMAISLVIIVCTQRVHKWSIVTGLLEAIEGSVVFGIQYFVKKYLIAEFNKWFALPKEEAIKQFAYRVGNFVDLNQVGTKHIEELYDLGYLPIEIKALPEGSICPIRVPMMTIKNTLPDFFW